MLTTGCWVRRAMLDGTTMLEHYHGRFGEYCRPPDQLSIIGSYPRREGFWQVRRLQSKDLLSLWTQTRSINPVHFSTKTDKNPIRLTWVLSTSTKTPAYQVFFVCPGFWLFCLLIGLPFQTLTISARTIRFRSVFLWNCYWFWNVACSCCSLLTRINSAFGSILVQFMAMACKEYYFCTFIFESAASSGCIFKSNPCTSQNTAFYPEQVSGRINADLSMKIHLAVGWLTRQNRTTRALIPRGIGEL